MSFSVTVQSVMEGERLLHQGNHSLLQAEAEKRLNVVNMAKGHLPG